MNNNQYVSDLLLCKIHERIVKNKPDHYKLGEEDPVEIEIASILFLRNINIIHKWDVEAKSNSIVYSFKSKEVIHKYII